MKAESGPDRKRSALMARVRQKGTSAELRVGKALRERGAAYRRNVRTLPGAPDFANRRRQWAVFVHGCFWHHHTGCSRATIPKSNTSFWRAKFEANRTRDARSIRELRRRRFRVVVIWECEIYSQIRLYEKLSQILESRRVDVAEPVNH